MIRPPGPFTDVRRRGWPALFALLVLATPVLAALFPPGVSQPVFLALAAALSVAIALAVVAVPWERLPDWTQAGPPMAFFAVVVLAEMAADERAPSLLALMLLPVLWLAANGTRMQVAVSLVGLATMGTAGVLTSDAGSGDWRRALVSLVVAGLISLGVQRAVETSRRAIARHQALVDHLPDTAVMTFDRDLRYETVGGPALSLFGAVPGDYEGKTLEEVIPKQRRAELERLYRDALDGKETSLDYRSSLNPDRELWLRAVPLPGKGGSVVGGMLVVQDVTERNRAEHGRREAEELFRRAFDDGAVGMAIISLDGHYLRVNRALCRLVGREDEDMRVRPFGDLAHPEDRERIADAFEGLLSGGGEAFRDQMRYLLPDGGVVWGDLACSMVRDEDGRPLYFVAQVEDVTDRKLTADALEHEQRFTEQLLESLSEGVVACDAEGNLALFNRATREFHGQGQSSLSPDQWADHYDLYHADGKTPMRPEDVPLFRAFRGEQVDDVEMVIAPNGQEPRRLLASGRRITSKDGQPLGAVVSMHDVTAQRQSESGLREAEERFRRAFEDAGTGMAVIGAEGHQDGRFLEVNDELCQITGYPREQLLRMTEASLLHPDDLPSLDDGVRAVVAGEATAHRDELRLISAGGDTLWVSVSTSVVRDDQGEAHMRLVQMLDVTERKRFEGQLQHLADHDPLTGLINRRRFEEELGRELAAAKRYDRAGAVLVLDLDNFKYMNDTHGHSAGDELIVTVSGLLRGRLRESDTLSRIGGDEFAVILPDCTPRQAEVAANGLLGTIRNGMLEHQRGGRSSASIGVAPYGAPYAATGEELLVEADVAMYEAKERGRDRVEVFERDGAAPSPLNGRLTWARRIEQALSEDGFELHAQPILSLGDDPVPRFELLVRMRGEDGDLIPPAAFLGVAERFELIQAIDRWVVSQAIGLLGQSQRRGDPVTFEVNLSAKSVTDPGLPDFIEDRLRCERVDPHGLIFEVTETAAIVNVDRARLFADRLGEVGCGFALDDFGAGFASFYYLKHLDFDLLKIDGEFIRGLPESRTNQLVVRSLVDLAQGLDKRTVAEFVGDEPTLSLLRSFGVDYAQGFHVGRPAPIGEAGLDGSSVGSAPSLSHP